MVAYVERMIFSRIQVTGLHQVSWQGKGGRVKQVDTCEDWHVGLQQQSSAEAMAGATPSLIFCLLSLFEAPACQHKPSVCRFASGPCIHQKQWCFSLHSSHHARNETLLQL